MEKMRMVKRLKHMLEILKDEMAGKEKGSSEYYFLAGKMSGVVDSLSAVNGQCGGGVVS